MSPRLLHYSDVENAYDDPERIGRLAGLIDALRDESTVVVGTGDNTSPGVLSLVTEAEQAIEFFRHVSPDLGTFGNHDFDYGVDRTVELVAETPQTWLTANVERDGSRFGAGVGTKPWTIEERDGRRIGFFGVTDPKTPSINPNATGLSFTDPIAAARDVVAELKQRDVDHVVALSHLGNGDQELAVETDVDAILGGHVHTEVVERVSGTLLTRPGVNGETLLEVELGPGGPTVTRRAVADGPLDERIAARMHSLMTDANLDETVGHVDEPIERTETTAFRGESRIGNFVADAYRWATGADVGLQNSGGIRAGNALDGEVTVAELVSVVPFEEPVSVVELYGDELLDVFHQASGANVAFGEPDWWHAHVSGARVVYHRGDGRVEEATVGGEPVDPAETYSVATSDYIFHTDHEFPVITEDKRVSTHDVQYEVLTDYAREVGLDPSIEGRIVRTG